MLQDSMTIIAYTKQVLDMDDLFWNLSKLNSRHINFYLTKAIQIEVGYGLMNMT